ncbi:hypothetical protein, partial [Catellatospora sp. NPDC049609]|uniref:hypothetical protein n=1 Tax=Catellatospora sp. NPDC049609 TaxID=3155505 RepID=UPI00344AC991
SREHNPSPPTHDRPGPGQPLPGHDVFQVRDERSGPVAVSADTPPSTARKRSPRGRMEAVKNPHQRFFVQLD